MVGKNSSCDDLPPGFRFHPTDEELIMFYLRNQATSNPCPVSIIPEVDIYKFDPWELPEKAEFGESEWYFFTPRDRKYPNGVRPNRAAVSGYWKATGTDKAIYCASKYVGVKKALVFYKGKPPKGIKTDWIMHEYRLTTKSQPHKQSGSMRLDDWVLCRIYKKKNMVRAIDHEIKVEEYTTISSNHVLTTTNDDDDETQQALLMKLPRTCSLTHLWEFEYLGSISQLLNIDNNYSSYNNGNFGDQNQNISMSSSNNLGNMASSAMKFQVNQPIYMNPTSLSQPAVQSVGEFCRFWKTLE